MELVICQNCAQIVRGRSKFCNGCGLSVSRFSGTTVPVFQAGTQALVLERSADPLVLERTVNRIIYGNGHGKSDGTGGFLYESEEYADEGLPDYSDSPSAASKATQGLSGVLGAAAGGAALAAAAAAGMMAADEDSKPDFVPEGPWDNDEPEETAKDKYFSLPDSQDDGSDDPPPTTEFAAPKMGPPPDVVEQDEFIPQGSPEPTGSSQAGSDDFFGESARPQSDPAPAGDDFFDDDKPPAPVSNSSNDDFFEEKEDFIPASSAGGDFIPSTPPAPKDDFFGDSTAVPSVKQDFIDDSFLPPAVPTQTNAVVPAQAEPSASFDPGTPAIDPPKPAGGGGGGGMDFFAATGGGFFAGDRQSPPANMFETNVANTGPVPQVGGIIAPTMGGTQASIIQSAIAAAMNAQKESATIVSETPELVVPGEETAKKKKKLKKPSVDEDDDAPKKKSSKSKGSDDDEDEVRPKKSSKSGSSSGSSKGYKNRSSASGKRQAREEASEGEKLEIMGLPIQKKVLVSGAVALVCLGFPLVVLISTIGGMLGNIGGLMGGGGGAVDMTGRWVIAFLDPSNPEAPPTKGEMTMIQRGSRLEGQGVDRGTPFQIGGDLKGGGEVNFSKQYFMNGAPAGKPISYKGKIDGVNGNAKPGEALMHVSGVWTFTKGVGVSWRRQIITKTGRFEAAMMSKNVAAAAGQTGPQGGVTIAPPANTGQDPKKMQELFFRVALGLLALGGAIVFASLKFFGPSGLLNIWAKKEYIPSQFKSQHYKLVREMGKPLKPGGIPIGTRAEWGIHQFWLPRKLAMPPDIREQNPHLLIIGQGSKGKSRFMASLIMHDIESADRSVIVCDSDGSLIDLVVNHIAAHPKGRQIAERVIVIDPTKGGETFCYNPLEYPEDGDLQNAAAAVVFGFKAIYTEPPGSQSQWNQQTANILRNAAVLLMANGKTLTDLPVLLSDNDFRDVLLEKVERMRSDKTEYTTLIENWTNYKRLARTDQWINWIEPILNRVQPMLSDPRIRPILTKPKGDLSISRIILDKKVLFVKIPQGQLDQNGNLLGSLIVTGVKQAALSLSVRYKNKKRPCSLYLDEFDTFIEKETFDAITTETRKFQIGLCSVAKTMQGLPEDYRNQIVANIGTMAVFSLTKKDGDMLGPQMFRVDGRKVKHQTISNVFNRVNTSPQFELISDEEKLNIDRVVAQEERTFFFYRVGSVAGVFNMKAAEVRDVPEKEINADLIELMHENRQIRGAAASDDDDDDDEEDDDD